METTQQMLQRALTVWSADFYVRARDIRARHGVQRIRKLRRANRFLRYMVRTWSEVMQRPDAAELAQQMRPLSKSLAAARDAATVERIARVLVREAARRKKSKLRKTGADLAARLKERRHAMVWPVFDEADRLLDSEVMTDLRALCDQPPYPAEGSVAGSPASDYIEQEVSSMLQELLQFESSLSDPAEVERRHEMRKLARGPLVLISHAPPEMASSLRDVLRAIQRLRLELGDLHDLEEAQSFLPRFCRAEAGRLGKKRVDRFIRFAESTLTTWHDKQLAEVFDSAPETLAVFRQWLDAGDK